MSAVPADTPSSSSSASSSSIEATDAHLDASSSSPIDASPAQPKDASSSPAPSDASSSQPADAAPSSSAPPAQPDDACSSSAQPGSFEASSSSAQPVDGQSDTSSSSAQADALPSASSSSSSAPLARAANTQPSDATSSSSAPPDAVSFSGATSLFSVQPAADAQPANAASSSVAQPTEFSYRYFVSISKEQVHVEWDDNRATSEPLRAFKKQCVARGRLTRREWEQLCAMADRDGDDSETRERKKEQRQQHWFNSPQGIRRSSRRKRSAEEACPAAEPAPTFTNTKRRAPCAMQHCSSCGLLGPGNTCRAPECESYQCYHCQNGNWTHCHEHGGQALVRSLLQQQHGAIRSAPVSVQFVVDDVAVRQLYEASVEQVSDTVPDIVVIQYHSSGLTEEDHVERLCAALAERSPAFLLVLTCWTDAAAQTAALRRVAVLHGSTTIVTFRHSALSGPDCLERVWPDLRDAILYPHTRPLHFLARAVDRAPGLVCFRQSGEAKHCAGPWRCVLKQAGRAQCVGCSEQYEGKGGRWQKSFMSVRRIFCRRTSACVDLLKV